MPEANPRTEPALINDWSLVKQLCKSSFQSSLHFAIASVNEQGEPHVTPIGSLILGSDASGIYFEKFTQQMPKNFIHNNKVCILAVNSSKWFWLCSLLKGKFSRPPAIRLYGTVGKKRPATDTELQLWQKRVSMFSKTKGHALLWKEMSMVREISFYKIEPVKIGKMTV